MKLAATIFLLSTCWVSVFGQPNKRDEPIKIVREIFESYIKRQESLDSEEDKLKMKKALTMLKDKKYTRDLNLLLDVWMYYMVTDFPTRDLIKSVLLTDKDRSIKAIEKRRKEKKEWETDESVEDLIHLKDQLTHTK